MLNVRLLLKDIDEEKEIISIPSKKKKYIILEID